MLSYGKWEFSLEKNYGDMIAVLKYVMNFHVKKEVDLF